MAARKGILRFLVKLSEKMVLYGDFFDLGREMNTPCAEYADERHVWQAFRQGHAAAYECLYRTHVAGLYAYAYNLVRNRETAEDCVQDLFVYLHQHRHTLSDTDSIRFYLLRSLRRRLATASKKTSATLPDTEPGGGFEVVPGPDQALMEDQANRERTARVLAALNQLPKRQREAVYLIYFQSLTYAEAADVMALEVKSVYNLVYKALQVMRQALGTLLRVLAALLLLRLAPY